MATDRGDSPKFLSIYHVLEFEEIYREEAKKRMMAGTPCANGTGGLTHACMARDSGAGGNK